MPGFPNGMNITLELPAHAGAIEALLDSSFGPKRHTKTVYRLRRGVAPIGDLCFVATDTGADGVERVVASIRYWPILIGGTVQAIMLGPIAVAPDLRSRGVGQALIRHSLARAAELGHRIVILVGDAPYYVRFGFAREKTLSLSLPGPVDPDRFLGLELVEGALDGVTGMIGRAVQKPQRKSAAAAAVAAPAPTAEIMPLPTAEPTPAAMADAALAVSAVGRRRLRRAARSA